MSLIYNIKSSLRDLSHQNKIINKMYRLGNQLKREILANIDDEKFAKIHYRENRGLKLDLENPMRFNEKLWWLKLNNRDPLLTKCSDKYAVREYVINKGYEDILVNLYGVYEEANEIPFNELPAKAFIKTNHGSGTNVLWDKEKNFNRNKFTKEFNKSLRQNYYIQSREWNYKNIKPLIIVEEFLENEDGSALIDYKFMCFHGEVRLVFVETNVARSDGTHNPYSKRNVYDRNFNYLDVRIGRENDKTSKITKPLKYKEMVECAEKLSAPFPHCRVDLYNVNGKIYFGEITFYHGGGCQKIEPDSFDYEMGSWIDLSIIKDYDTI